MQLRIANCTASSKRISWVLLRFPGAMRGLFKDLKVATGQVQRMGLRQAVTRGTVLVRERRNVECLVLTPGGMGLRGKQPSRRRHCKGDHKDFLSWPGVGLCSMKLSEWGSRVCRAHNTCSGRERKREMSFPEDGPSGRPLRMKGV